MQTVSSSNQNHRSSAHLGPSGDARKCFDRLPVRLRLIVTKLRLLIACDGVTLMKPTFRSRCFVRWSLSPASCFCTCVIPPKRRHPPSFDVLSSFRQSSLQIALSDISIWVNKMRSGWRHPGRRRKHPLPEIKAAFSAVRVSFSFLLFSASPPSIVGILLPCLRVYSTTDQERVTKKTDRVSKLNLNLGS